MSVEEPEIVQINVASKTRDYLAELNQLGLLEGDTGGRALGPEVAAVVNALHHVLAGGRATVQLDTSAAASVTTRLDQLRDDAMAEHNSLDATGLPIRVMY